MKLEVLLRNEGSGALLFRYEMSRIEFAPLDWLVNRELREGKGWNGDTRVSWRQEKVSSRWISPFP